MLFQLVMPGILVSVCVVIHALVMTALLGRLSRSAKPTRFYFLFSTWVLIRVTLWILSAHLLEIGIWAHFFAWQQVFPDFKTAFYFSAVTYTTVGYGDLVLPEPWRLLAGVEGLTGILMCGWSTGVFFAVISRMYFAKTTEVEARGRR